MCTKLAIGVTLGQPIIYHGKFNIKINKYEDFCIFKIPRVFLILKQNIFLFLKL